MKYIKTFEGFKPINEELLGIDLSKMKQAIMAVSDKVKSDVIPNMDEAKKAELEEKLSQFMQKSGIKSQDELINKVSGEITSHEDEIEEVSAEVKESFSLNEALGERAVRFFKRLGTYAGIGTMLVGFTAFISNVTGYIDSSILTKLHEITQGILGMNAGPIGFLIVAIGIAIAFGSQVWGANRGV